MNTEDFEELARDAGLPVSEAEIEALYEQELQDSDLIVNNKSSVSPFWRLIRAVAVAPVKWLIEFIITSVLVQSFVETATGIYLDLHARGFNLFRILAGKARGNIVFTRVNTAGNLMINAGTVIQSLSIGGRVYSLKTISDAIFNDGESNLTVLCEAFEAGQAYNLGAGSYTRLEPPINGMSVTNGDDWLVTPGNDEESNDELRARIKDRYVSVSNFHIDAAYRVIIARFPGVLSSNIFFEHNAPNGPGTANAFILLETGNASPDFIAQIQSDITDNLNHGLGDEVTIRPIPETFHDVICNVWFLNSIDESQKNDLLTRIDSIIRCAFRLNDAFNVVKTRPESIFSFSNLEREIHDLVPQVLNISFNLDFIDNGAAISRINSLEVNEIV